MSQKDKEAQSKTIALNRKARFEYEILETIEAGITLMGSELKSIRQGKVSINEAHAFHKGEEIWLHNCDIGVYPQAGKFGHEPKRIRKLLLKKVQIRKLIGKIKEKGNTIVPLAMYFNARGFVKVEIAVAKGKKAHDKRDTIKKRDWDRQKSKIMKDNR